MTPEKRPRPAGRLAQLSKRLRLVRRSLRQWHPQPPQEPRFAVLKNIKWSPIK